MAFIFTLLVAGFSFGAAHAVPGAILHQCDGTQKNGLKVSATIWANPAGTSLMVFEGRRRLLAEAVKERVDDYFSVSYVGKSAIMSVDRDFLSESRRSYDGKYGSLLELKIGSPRLIDLRCAAPSGTR